MPMPMSHTRRAFSLAELCVSLLILSVLAVLMVGVIPASIFGVRNAEERAAASVLSRDLIEELRATGFSHLNLQAQTYAPSQTREGIEYFLIYAVSDPGLPRDPADKEDDGTPRLTAKQIDVEVRWKSRQGAKRLQASEVITRR